MLTNWASLNRVVEDLGPEGGEAWAVIHRTDAQVGDEVEVMRVKIGPLQPNGCVDVEPA